MRRRRTACKSNVSGSDRTMPLQEMDSCSCRQRVNPVGVGIMIAHNPIHGSGQAELPHPALTSGNNAHAAQGIRMTSTGGRQPAVERAPPPAPEHVGVLAAPRKGAGPEPADLEPK